MLAGYALPFHRWSSCEGRSSPPLQAGVRGVQNWMNWDLLGLSWLSFVEKPIFSRLVLTWGGRYSLGITLAIRCSSRNLRIYASTTKTPSIVFFDIQNAVRDVSIRLSAKPAKCATKYRSQHFMGSLRVCAINFYLSTQRVTWITSNIERFRNLSQHHHQLRSFT